MQQPNTHLNVFLLAHSKQDCTQIITSLHIIRDSSSQLKHRHSHTFGFTDATYDLTISKSKISEFVKSHKGYTKLFIFAYDPQKGKSPPQVLQAATEVCNSVLQLHEKMEDKQQNCFMILSKSNSEHDVSERLEQANSFLNTIKLVLPTQLIPTISRHFYREYHPLSDHNINRLRNQLKLIADGQFNQIPLIRLNEQNQQAFNPLNKVQDKVKQQESQFFIVYTNKRSHASALQKNEPNIIPQPFNQKRNSVIRQSFINNEEVSQMRFPSDQIICKQEDSLSLAQSITCPICLLILQTPYYECQGCSNGFCTLCLESWWKKSPNSCAFKCQNVDFKQVKRSNTYNAVISILKIKCTYCRQEKTIAELSNHIIKVCPEVDMICRFCDEKKKRKVIDQHESQQCGKRPWKCQHCQVQYCHQDKQLHLNVCGEVENICSFQGCPEKIKRKEYDSHIKSCGFKKIDCEWCKQQMKLKEYDKHLQICEKRTVLCNWCDKQFKPQQSIQHELLCQLRKQGCRLCKQLVYAKQMSSHKIQCMFENVIQIKNKNESLETQNIRLKEKIMILQGCIEQTIANRESSAMKVVSKMREQDKKIVEKDLLRLDNSIRSVEKLRKQEIATHMKFPHLIQAWCPICKQLDKKFKAILQPLFQQRKQVLTKLTEMQRYSFTPK